NAPTGVQALSVTTTGGTSNALAFTVFPPAPVLTTITPSVGVQATSVNVTIAGSNLTGSVLNLPTGVTVATTPAPVITATQITATLAIAVDAPTGAQSISVTTAGGTSNALIFTINPPGPTLN